jgi:very-short-patch-repair endonuclease
MHAAAPDPDLKPRVRDLRSEATPAETKLWAAIRGGKLGYRFEKQSRRERFLDFFCPEANLAVEVEGHVRTAAEDQACLAGLKARGVRLLRFSNDDVPQAPALRPEGAAAGPR